MTTILLRLSWMNTLMQNPQLSPLNRQLTETQWTHRCKRASIVGANSLWQSMLPDRSLANRIDVFEVHFGNSLTTADVSAMRVRNRERIATIFVAATEKPLKSIHHNGLGAVTSPSGDIDGVTFRLRF
jgi:hypothetical protein